MNEIVSLIESVGFPMVVAVGLGFFIKDFIIKVISDIQQDAKEDRRLMEDELKFNRHVSGELLETNKLLAKDLTEKLEGVNDKLDILINKKKDE